MVTRIITIVGSFTCNGAIAADTKFGPPEFPNVITTSTGASCSWVLYGSSNRNYIFKLTYFDVPSSPDCQTNSVKVYRNNNRTPDNLLATLCGELSDEERIVTGGSNYMTVTMEVNDRSTSFRGFYGQFEEQ